MFVKQYLRRMQTSFNEKKIFPPVGDNKNRVFDTISPAKRHYVTR